LPNSLDWKNNNLLGLLLVYDLVTELLEGNIIVGRNHGRLFHTLFHIQFAQLTLDKLIANGAS
jgi:two-component sensor histidine kinase